MSLQPGTRLGPYAIEAPVGAGGMGEVYRARDTRLDRTVAIKVLPAHVASDPQFRERFDREARVISSLDHPHICALYDVGHERPQAAPPVASERGPARAEENVDFLVMQYLEGESLAERLRGGPLPPDQALRYGIEISDALDAAHRRGIVHRDLKPGNVMVTKSGAKLLDFGLAKTAGPAKAGPHASPGNAAAAGSPGARLQPDLTAPPTFTTPLTAQGMILGTFQYMAPEQIEGQDADARTDIFALGAVLYEMVTGRKAFEGKTQASLLGAILKDTPPAVSTIAPVSPPALDRIVTRCLEKDPDDRWQSARDVMLELRSIAQGKPEAPSAAPSRRARAVWPWIAAALALVLFTPTAWLAMQHLRERPEPARVARFVVSLPTGLTFRFGDYPKIAPDGTHIAFTAAASDGRAMLWVRSLESPDIVPLPGTEGAAAPFWSPDSRRLAFVVGGVLKTIDLQGGSPHTVCRAPGFASGAWGANGTLVFSAAASGTGGLYKVAASGGEPTPLTTLDPNRAEQAHAGPTFLSDGRHILFLVRSTTPGVGGVYVASVDAPQPTRVAASDAPALYAAPGYLLFSRTDTLMAQAFDPERLELAGEAVPVAQGAARRFGTTWNARYSVSQTGVLAYSVTAMSALSRLTWFDRSGRTLGTVGNVADYSNPALSPDGRRLAVGLRDPQTGNRDVWIFDLGRGTSSRFTFDPADDFNPSWSPDGTRIAFSSDRKGARDLYVRAGSGAADEEALFLSKEDKHIEQWAPDGRSIVYNTASTRITLLPLEGPSKARPTEGPPRGLQARVSPDGRWIVYVSDESGRFEVYVQTFPDLKGRWQVSTGGGTEPEWRADGRELYYLASTTLMAVPVGSAGSQFEAGTPRALFDVRSLPPVFRNRYVVTPDGQRFLVNVAEESSPTSAFTVVLNWHAAIER